MFCIADQQHLPYSSANFLLFNKDSIWPKQGAPIVPRQFLRPEGEEGALGMSSTSSLAGLTG